MLNILVVDDSLMSIEKLVNILTKLGHNIVGTAINGAEAVDLTKKFKPDLVTMDLIMPKMNGIEAIKKIKEYDKKTMIMVVSANKREEDILMSFKQGATGYILKPFTISEIEKEIGNIFPEYYIESNGDILDDKQDANN